MHGTRLLSHVDWFRYLFSFLIDVSSFRAIEEVVNISFFITNMISPFVQVWKLTKSQTLISVSYLKSKENIGWHKVFWYFCKTKKHSDQIYDGDCVLWNSKFPSMSDLNALVNMWITELVNVIYSHIHQLVTRVTSLLLIY